MIRRDPRKLGGEAHQLHADPQRYDVTASDESRRSRHIRQNAQLTNDPMPPDVAMGMRPSGSPHMMPTSPFENDAGERPGFALGA